MLPRLLRRTFGLGGALVAVAGCAGALLAGAGCTGTETGNPPLDGTMSVNAHSSDSASVALISSEGGAVVDELWLGLGDVLVEPCEGDALVVPEVGVDEHASQVATQHPFLAARTAICRVRVRFVRASVGPEAIRNRSTLVRGRDADGRAFEIALALDTEVELPAAVDLDETHPALLLAVDVARWVGNLDLASGTADVDGVVRIDETNNPTLRDAFLGNVAEGFELYRDDDADGVADDGEPFLGRGVP
ncbi:MAG: hypothetical protein H6722_19070 [Sandaracinus sp.]|nr:hypothetical protein [Sandaracinus sp.]